MGKEILNELSRCELLPKIQNERTKPEVSSWRGPKRALRLCLLGVLLPGIILAVPLYLKHRVYDYTIYPVAMSDMRLIDNRVSTTWCQRQRVYANTTFNAFLMPGLPHVSRERIPVSMIRHLKLTDDMKEYWGFYLLRGSIVTVSTCVRWPGASLILIRGHRHLHECAYIGDDSSEEIEELMEIAAEKGLIEYVPNVSSDSAPTNTADLLTKYRNGIVFHDPNIRQNIESFRADKKSKNPKPTDEESESNDRTAKEMKELLSLLAYKAGKKRNRLYNEGREKNGSVPMPIKTFGTKEELLETIKHKLVETGKGHNHTIREPNFGNDEAQNVKFQVAPNNATSIHINETRSQETDLKNLEIPSNVQSLMNETSIEEFEKIVGRLKFLGSRGKRILDLLKDQVVDNTNRTMNNEQKVEIQNLTKNIEISTEKLLREKREVIKRTSLNNYLNADDMDKENRGLEEEYEPDGIADHHRVLNQSTMNDRSNSEFWSSFSSSEEALMNCAGLILSLPLNPSKFCKKEASKTTFGKASLANTITYTVPTNGYYFFVFNSENEVQENYLQVQFDIQKTIYNVSNPISKCSNVTDQCTFPLHFFSNEKVIFEFPVKQNDTMWNEEFMVVSECEPRTIVYVICVLSVPLIILLFAFQ